MKMLPFPLIAALALAACDGGTPDEAAPDAATAPTPADIGDKSVPPDNAVPDDESAMANIPAGMQGRWGLVAGDCEPGRDDAKGLMTVSPRELEFYESVGTLDEITDPGATRIRAAFDFSGEGMSWRRDLSLELQDGGKVLVRREYGEDAATEPFRYSRCG